MEEQARKRKYRSRRERVSFQLYKYCCGNCLSTYKPSHNYSASSIVLYSTYNYIVLQK